MAQKGRITVDKVMQALRNHGPDVRPDWSPARGLSGATVCKHAAFGPIRIDQTTGSMVSHLARDVQTHYVTGTAAPCTSLFKPIWLGTDLPDTGPVPTGAYDAATLFWRHEALHRATLRDYATRVALYQEERDALERQLVEGAQARRDQPLAERATYSERCFVQAAKAEAGWTARVRDAAVKARPGRLYSFAWRRFNRGARLPS
jgi:dipeptidase